MWFFWSHFAGKSPSTAINSDAFGIADISTISHDAMTGLGRIPAGVSVGQLLAKGSSATQGTSVPLSYAVWTFDDSVMSNLVKASMQSGTTARGGAYNGIFTCYPPLVCFVFYVMWFF